MSGTNFSDMFSSLNPLAKGRQHETHNIQSTDRHQESLLTVLPTREDRANLLLLIAELIESARGRILDTFDAGKVDTKAPLKLGRSKAKQSGQNTDLEDRPNSADQSKPDQTDAERFVEESGSVVKANEAEKEVARERTALEKRARELAKPENEELKEAALSHFDDWRDRVMQRIEESINQHEPGDETAHRAQAQAQAPASRHTCQEELQRAGSMVDGQPMRHIFPPIDTPLNVASKPRRMLIMHSVLLILLGLEAYSAESRVLMLRLASSLGLSIELLAQDERSVAKGLLDVAQQQMNADEETRKKAAENSTARKWKVGVGAVAGAVLIGITGGLAAPLLAAGVGTVMGGLGLGATATAGYLGALAGSAPLVGALFGAYGGRMTGKMVDQYAKEVQDFAFLPVNQPSSTSTRRDKHDDKDARHLRVSVGISGWLVDESDLTSPWNVISGRSTEVFALRWELDALLRLGCALNTYIKSYAWSFAKKELLSRTIFAALASALTLPYGLAKMSRVIDNPFSVAISRSEKVGKVLADALVNKVQGKRPVTLVGYSLGARVIYSCLAELANRKAFGLVESVCLMGAAAPSDPILWRRICSVVSGRVVNVYSTKDYLLAFLYRANSLQYGVAGLQAIEGVPAIENVHVSNLVDGHTQYRFLVGSILESLDLEDIDGDVVAEQMRKLKRQEEETNQARESNVAEGNKSAEEEADQMEEEVERKCNAARATEGMGSKK